jgi:hypothetical protein
MDNALPHLDTGQLEQAASAIAAKLRPGGLFVASIRDYDMLISTRPVMQEPSFYGAPGSRRIVHQVWDWTGERSYLLHLYITIQTAQGWQANHFATEYRCLLRDQLSAVLCGAGFCNVRWLMPAESEFYQPIVLANWPA